MSAAARHPRARRSFDVLVVAAGLGALIAALLGWAHDGRMPVAVAVAVVVLAPGVAALFLRTVRGSAAVVLGVALATTAPGGAVAPIAAIWGVVTLLALGVGHRAGSVLIAGAALVAVGRHTDLGAAPYDQTLTGLCAYLLTLWILFVVRDVLTNGWSNRTALTRRTVTLGVGGGAYAAGLIGVVVLLSRAGDSTAVAIVLAVVLVLVGIVALQAARIRVLNRTARALTEAAVTTPWPEAEIDDILLRLVRTHVRGSSIEIRTEPSDGSLWAPVDDTRCLVIERQRGDFGFTNSDARLVAGLTSMARSSHQHARREAQLLREAVTDNLTGLWEYAHWHRAFVPVSRERSGSGLGVIFLDLDGFKQVNGIYGHLVADEILAAVGARLQEPPEGFVAFCRFGGDEFMGWCEAADESQLRARCDQLARTIALPIALSEETVSVRASIGRTFSPTAADDPEQLIAAAEQDMRRRKLARPQSRIPHTHYQSEVITRLLDGGAVDAAYQPIHDLATHRIVGFEALVRARNVALGHLPPPVLIESASAAGRLDDITRAVADQALATVSRAARLAGEPLLLTINLELEQLRSDSALLDHLVASVTPEVALTLEITERGVGEWTDRHDQVAAELRGRGMRIAVDDLGAGQASMPILMRHAWDVVKLDRTYLIGDADRCATLLGHVWALIRDLGMTAVLEGVETMEHLVLAEQAGIPLAQGYLLGPPVPGSLLLTRVARRGLAAETAHS